MVTEFQNTTSECTAYDGLVEDKVKFRFGKLPEYSKISTRKCLYPIAIATLAVVSGISLVIAAIAFSQIKQPKRDLQLDSPTVESQRQVMERKDNILIETKGLKLQVDEMRADNETLHRQVKKLMSENKSLNLRMKTLAENVNRTVTQLQRSNSRLHNILSQTKVSLFNSSLTIEGALYRLTGWETSGNLSYKFFSDSRVSYATAKQRCANDGGRLASTIFRDLGILANIKSKGLVKGYTWIGYDDIGREGRWQWSDGRTTNSRTTRWRPGQPDNWANHEDCGIIYSNTQRGIVMSDLPCRNRYNYVCELDSNENV